ncbi:MAG: hypothetical protein A3C11_01065 [Candidatus Sungbacteria bacterium RIFCSPHIGHO2_02_FULL_49_12]|uniref:Sortase n=2 Tax=Parcubacteria group TaxID=1794811 RepID=A0A1G2CHT5_9BACT|nr:MAG: hypothetical protein A2945_05225 [Candidatus Liptonbacteria bacterium RIFCSPLOWO2_01_FULL_52_25]OHA01535.1 MAG: hypothetical protein A3C11_01065 [Candidatus Sungbacteria bacterium RIFCSPHIGHO2_02_FULL_49_12]
MQQPRPQLLRINEAVKDAAVFVAKARRHFRFSAPGPFLFYWAVSFLLIFAALYSFGFAPDGVLEVGDTMTATVGNQSDGVASSQSRLAAGVSAATTLYSAHPATTTAEKPRLIIPSIGLNAAIELPKSADLDTLNTALLDGPAYYPGSGTPGQVGNVFIFGHSSLLSVVHNQNFKVFNGLKDLKSGDVIRLQWNSVEYWYQVKTVSIKKANDAEIDLATDKRLLTLSTCQIVGGKENRYVVEAEFMRSYPLKII